MKLYDIEQGCPKAWSASFVTLFVFIYATILFENNKQKYS